MGKLLFFHRMKIFNLYRSFRAKEKRKEMGENTDELFVQQDDQMCDPLLRKPENSINPTSKYM